MKKSLAILAVVSGLVGSVVSGSSVSKPVETKKVAAAQTQYGCQTPPAGTKVKIAVMGDSIMTNWGASTPANGWPELMKANAVSRQWHVNIGSAVGATKVTDFLPGGGGWWITECVRNMQPHFVTLDWRTNEQLANPIVTPAQMKSHYLQLMDHILAVSPTTKFVIINPPLNMYHVSFQTPYTQQDYIAKMIEVRNERGTHWLDLRWLYPTSGDLAWQMQPDGIHGGNLGHRVQAGAIDGFFLNLKVCGC